MEKRETLLTAAAVLGGNFLYALTVKLFIMPGELVTGGATGIALVVNRLTDIPVSAFLLVFNLAMLLLGWRVLGRAFALTTVVSTFASPLFLGLLERLLKDAALTRDPVLCTVFSGLGIGLALGILIRAGASSGGMDIPPLILNKLWKVPVSAGLYGFDCLILLGQGFLQPAQKVLYGILLVMIYSLVLDRVLLLGTAKIEMKIISRRWREVADAILREADRGVTLLPARGGYLDEEREIVLSVVSQRELPRLQKRIRAIDPACFLVITRVSEVQGRGFSMEKEYRQAGAPSCKQDPPTVN